MTWHVYMIRYAGGKLYTGICTDIDRRFSEHSAGGRKAAKSLRGRGPLTLVWKTSADSRSHASRLEYQVRHLDKALKEKLILGDNSVLCPPAE